MKIAILAAATALALTSTAADAAVDIYVSQTSGGVLMQVIGTLDLTGLVSTGVQRTSGNTVRGRDNAFLFVGQAGQTIEGYTGFTGPSIFGSQLNTSTSGGTGTAFGFNTGFTPMQIFLPLGFVSGGAVNSAATYTFLTIASMELIVGNYTYTSAADSISLHIGQAAPSAVPEPASWAMMVAGFGLLGAAMRRRTTVRFAKG
ncbi:PEP-CTERM sorting domain-containing protein [Sphingomonas sp. AP4-R1]|uniref:PEPxxWA-CTERM sorting domain-containing protein n=1 Tax=Sphingomonas sp. AP4-R1 TaxID=2735134 RepID=UPI00149379A2|nr:PEPxxWA-CTERM sorting domain-containing protein [Sphingomonas sp. AP4-R1]QJU57684.1 PEP-CTERM sorting domain-containing protein [Sphingomonas sp. AP4-R1]